MCTVVFIPFGDTYKFASLRDESPMRPKAVPPKIYKNGNNKILSPTDALAGGSWLGVNANGTVIILLNGGFEAFTQNDTYTRSRGLIVSELLASDIPLERWGLLDLFGVAPFTLVVWHKCILSQLVWDGMYKHTKLMDPHKPYLWSSTTLYDKDSRALRNKLFERWIAHANSVSAFCLFDFFNSYSDDANGFLMNRKDQIKTLSYTYIDVKINSCAEMKYFDLCNNSIFVQEIVF